MSLWTDPVNFIAQWLTGVLTGWGLPLWLSSLLLQLIGVVVLVSLMMLLDILLVWVERKVVARFQDRLGPNRVGPFGLIQPFADIIKLLIKEDITPDGADRVVYNLAPVLSLMSVLLLWAIVPLAPVILGVDLNVGALYIIAAGAIGTLSIIMAAWASNNKYALIGAFRQVAVLVSFEVPMIATMLIPTVLAGSMGMNAIVQAQRIWFFFLAPLAAIIFMVAAIAELGRTPFDMNEAESEIVAGFHIEYTGMKFGLFYAGELLHAFTFGGFWAILFFGGYRFFGLRKPRPHRCRRHSARQGHVRLLGHHVDPLHGHAYPHRRHVGLQLEIPDAVVLRPADGDCPGERAAAWRRQCRICRRHAAQRMRSSRCCISRVLRGYTKRERERVRWARSARRSGSIGDAVTAMQVHLSHHAAVILGSAVMVVTTRNLIHCALWLIVTLVRCCGFVCAA